MTSYVLRIGIVGIKEPGSLGINGLAPALCRGANVFCSQRYGARLQVSRWVIIFRRVEVQKL